MFACIWKGPCVKSVVSAPMWQRWTYVVCLSMQPICGPCTCWGSLWVWSLYLCVAGVGVYIAVCVHTSVYGVCVSVWLELVCVFAVCTYPVLWWLHRCVVGFVCLCAHVCAGAGKRVHLRYECL